jgi:hypothetical protein
MDETRLGTVLDEDRATAIAEEYGVHYPRESVRGAMRRFVEYGEPFTEAAWREILLAGYRYRHGGGDCP